jgi:DNA-binding transcriptional ArsR family regulator
MAEAMTIQQACSSAIESQLDPDLFKALGDPTRLAIVVRLATAGHPLTVSEVSGCCDTHLSGVSRHLAHLNRAGVVSSRRVGREVRYRLNHALLAKQFTGLVAAISACREHCCPPETQSIDVINEAEVDWT